MKFQVTVLTLIGLLLVGAAAMANSNDEEAKEAFKSAVKLYRKSAYEEASREFRRANSLKPTFSLLYNIGQSEAAAKRYGLAFEAFEEYIARGGDEIKEDRREEVLRELERLSKVIGSIEVSAPSGSVVVVDDMERGKAPLPGHIRLAMGVVHRVEIRNGDDTILTENIKVSFGEVRKIVVDDESVSEVAAAPQVPEEAAPQAEIAAEPKDESVAADRNYKTVETAAWVTLASGGAMLVGAIVTGTIALQKNSALDSKCVGSVCPESEQGSGFTRDNLALSTDILIGAGATAAVAGGVLLIWSKKKRKDNEHADISTTPVIGNGAAGIGISGAF